MAAHDPALLHNVFWRCLDGPHRHLSDGLGLARRYRAGYSPIGAFADPAAADLDSLTALTAPGEALYVAGWNGACTSCDWSVEVDAVMVCMSWNGGPAPGPIGLDVRPLGPGDVAAVMRLVDLTHPGPFGPHTVDMGEFIGHFAPDGTLIAMAGERTCFGAWREVSGICTDPDHQGKGLGRALTNEVVRRQLLRGEMPYLHVLASNQTARAMYRRLGFQEQLETPIRVMRRV